MEVDFWNSVGDAPYLRELAEELARCGVTLRVRSGLRHSGYWQARGRIGRFLLRWRMLVIHPLRLTLAMAFGRTTDVCVVTSNPFFAPWLAVRLAGRRRRVVQLLYDLYPETLLATGLLRRGGRGERLARRVVKDALRRASVNVALGARLARHLRDVYGDAAARLSVIPVGSCRMDAGERPSREQAPVILYCGNMGRLHDTDTVLRHLLAGTGATDAVQWRFHATGAGYARFKARLAGDAGDRSPLTRVHLGSSLDESGWAMAMAAADVALVTMRHGAESVLLPSKVYSALLAGQAVLAVCPRESDLADLVQQHACGWVVEPGDTEAFAAAVGEIARDREALRRRQANARAAGEREYGVAAVARQWAPLLLGLASCPAPPCASFSDASSA